MIVRPNVTQAWHNVVLPFVCSAFLISCIQQRTPDQHVDVTTIDAKGGERIRFVGDCDSISHECINATETVTKKDGSEINRRGEMRDPTAPAPPPPLPPNAIAIPEGYTYIDPRLPAYGTGSYGPNCHAIYDHYGHVEAYMCP